MTSIVDQLARQALDDSVPLDSLLRRVKAVAILLDLDELAQWAERELCGYGPNDEVPSYRMMNGEAQGLSPGGQWIPIVWENHEQRKHWSTWPMRDSIAEIFDRVQRKDANWILPLGAFPLRGPLGKEMTNVGLHVDRAVFVNVISIVRSKISDWAIKLKKAGISGEGLSFTEPEKQKAHQAGVTVNIGHIEHLTGSVGEISGHATISSQTAVAPLNLEQIRNLLAQLQNVSGLPDPELIEIGKAASSLAVELRKEKPEPSRIREVLQSIRNVAEGAAGNVVALGIARLVATLLGP